MLSITSINKRLHTRAAVPNEENENKSVGCIALRGRDAPLLDCDS